MQSDCKIRLYDFYITIAVSIEVVMHWRKLARLIKWCKIYLISDTCNIPVSCLSRVPTVAFKITNGINKHTTLIDSLLIFGRDALIHRTTKEEYYWMLMFEENIENLLFEWRVKTADDN